VGTDGAIIRWDGNSWRNVTSPTSEWLNSVDIFDSSEAWIVGANGTIYRWQEETSNGAITYILIISVVVIVAIVVFFLRKRSMM
jgi:hypothetical protein